MRADALAIKMFDHLMFSLSEQKYGTMIDHFF